MQKNVKRACLRIVYEYIYAVYVCLYVVSVFLYSIRMSITVFVSLYVEFMSLLYTYVR